MKQTLTPAGAVVAVMPGDRAAVIDTGERAAAASAASADVLNVGGGVAIVEDDAAPVAARADAVAGTKTTGGSGYGGRGETRPLRMMATRQGLLHAPAPACAAWVETSARRYSPAPGENVVGVVVERHAEHFAVDIGASGPAILPLLAFEGATRRNRPALAPGALVYARVVDACRDMDPELSCTDADGRAAGFGELGGEHGFALHVSTTAARALLAYATGNSELARRLKRTGDATPFEMVVGMNGRVWLTTTRRAADTLRVAGIVADAMRDL